MIDVLMLTIDDNANTGWKTFQCLKRLGLNVMYFKGSMHPYCYPEQGVIHPLLHKIHEEERGKQVPLIVEAKSFKPLAQNSKCIHYIASRIVDTGIDVTRKRFVMQHSGRLYRVMHESFNKVMNPLHVTNIIQMPDLMGLGAKDEHLIYFPTDTDYLKPTYAKMGKELIIGHFPSLSTEKGTNKIVGIAKRLNEDRETKGKFDYRGVDKAEIDNHTIWIWQLQRMAECDVIVDVCADTAQGKPYGEWGNTAFESAALGKIPITNSHRLDMYEREYGCRPAMRIANSEQELEKHLRELIALPEDKLLEEKKAAREWVHRCHGFDATARRLWEKVYKKILG